MSTSNKILNEILSALSDPTRRRMVEMLCAKDLTVSQLAEPFKLTLPTVTRHIQILERAGLVSKKKAGQQRVCRVSRKALGLVSDWHQGLAPSAPEESTTTPTELVEASEARPKKTQKPGARAATTAKAAASAKPSAKKAEKPAEKPAAKTEKVVLPKYGLQPTTLGILAVAVNANGVCGVVLADDETAAVAELRGMCGEVVLDGKRVRKELKAVSDAVESPSARFKGPMHLEGTEFQKRVWSALQEIPAGTTLTYTELAEKLGDPDAVRAVASACGANKLAVIIPCHRVLRHDGNLAGYRWGVERKRQLLEREGALQTAQLNLLG